MKIDILAIWAHPDDIELSCSWTLLNHIQTWYTVGLCDLTEWELGTRWDVNLRREEAELARDRLGAQWRMNLWMPDGFFAHTENNLKKIVSLIRKSKPTIVFANAPSDRHPDHGKASQLIKEACFLSWLVKIDDWYEPHRPRSLYFYIQDRYLDPDFVVNISEVYTKKREIIESYWSQFWSEKKNLLSTKELETPISTKQFLDSLSGREMAWWREIWATYAEGFICERILGVDDLMKIK